ncbi:hypothetical protein ACQPUY_13035 [Clostridium nigeriense]|uniref:hypothetical protein n=1 Tax=Clostridium nigeriense TaxID=1805470 RepID=UPI003D33F12D
MKRILIYICTIIIGASIPIYFFLIWEPLNSKDVLSENAIGKSSSENIDENNMEVLNDENRLDTLILPKEIGSSSMFNYLESDKRERLNSLLKNLSVVDLIKVNDYFSDKNNNEKIKVGVELVKKRMSASDYEIFKNVIEDQVDSSVL